MADGWTVEERRDEVPGSDDAGDGVALRWEIRRIAEGVLELSYEVVNGSSEAVLLCTPLTELRGGEAVAAPGRVYRYVDPDGVLQITKRLWHLPEDADVYRPELPMLTRVAPGGSLRESIRLAEPVVLEVPYRLNTGAKEPDPGVASGTAHAVRFSIGYFQVRDMPAAHARHGTCGPCMVVAQMILTTDPIEDDVAVKDTAA